tara:strand:- start:1622 stop:1834 length:213 start_codon:yes stop_codon:yes gene_type:complete
MNFNHGLYSKKVVALADPKAKSWFTPRNVISTQLVINIPVSVLTGDDFELFTRNMTNTSNILIQDGTVVF